MYSFVARTIQASAIKTIVEVLSNILNDVNFHIDSTGIKILALDSSHCALVHLKLDAENFEEFRCDEPCYLGLNLLNLFKLMKTVTNSDELLFRMQSSAKSCYHLEIVISNAERNSSTVYKIKLLDIDLEKIKVPNVEYDVLIKLQSSDFQKICRDMSQLSEIIHVRTLSDSLELSCTGDIADQSTTLGKAENGVEFMQFVEPSAAASSDEAMDDDSDATGPREVSSRFSLKFINLFCRASSLCPTVELYLKQNYPLVMLYNMSLGTLKFVLAPKAVENN